MYMCCRLRKWRTTVLTTTFTIFMIIWITVNTELINRNAFLTVQHNVQPVFANVAAMRRDNKGLPQELDGSLNATMILVLTYFRSGSTLTGDMFHYNPAAMYFFEPLRSLQIDFRAERPLHYLNFGCKFPRTNEEISDVSVTTLRNIFTCRFENLDVAALLQHHLGASRTTQQLQRCTRKTPNEAGIKECLRPFREECRGYGIRAIKTVRLSIADAGLLLKELPNLKVIHLIRDPRGMIKSRSSLGEFPWSNVDSGSKVACDEIVANLNSSERLYHLYPDIIKTILYEQIAETPLEALKEIYNFSNIPVDETTVQWLKNATMSGKEVKCVFCSTKANSTKTAYKWRQTIHFKYVRIIDRNCKSLYDKLGYTPIQNVIDLRKLTFNSRHRVRYLNNNL